MANLNIKEFGKSITHLIQKKSLTREEASQGFSTILRNETSEIQQGAFLAALAAKGETKEEIAGCWQAIYDFDTNKVSPVVNSPLVENSGTGMDSFKTFNISTCASLVAAAGGVLMARHGSRSITSGCGTVDMAELMGVDVECKNHLTVRSIEETNIGLFNGMSSNVHPGGLGRILSQISFGSTLNISASLASPVKVDIGVRGVYSRDVIRPTIEVMKLIGYKKALVFYGGIDNNQLGMDEASVAGETFFAGLNSKGEIYEFSLRPEDVGLNSHEPGLLTPDAENEKECGRVIGLLSGQQQEARFDAVAYNAGLIFYLTEKSDSIKQGVLKAASILQSGAAINTLEKWVAVQNRNTEQGLKKLKQIRDKYKLHANEFTGIKG